MGCDQSVGNGCISDSGGCAGPIMALGLKWRADVLCELLVGPSTCAKLEPIISLPDRPCLFGEGLSPAFRLRLFLGCAFRTGGCRFASKKRIYEPQAVVFT